MIDLKEHVALGRPAAPSRQAKVRRFLLVAGTGVVLAVALNIGVTLWLQSRPAARAPLSPVFAAPAALADLQAAAVDLPRDAEIRLELGKAYLQYGHTLSAIDELQAALRLGGPEAPIRRSLSAALAAVDRYEEALNELRLVKRLEPDALDLPLQEAAHRMSLGDNAGAVRVLDAIPRGGDGYPTLEYRDGPVAAMERLAGAYGELQVLDKSLALARRVLKDHPERPVGHLVAGRALLEQGKAQEAIPELLAAQKALGPAPELQLLLVRAWKLAGSLENEQDVLVALEGLQKRGAASGQVYLDLGVIYERRHQWERAGDAFRHAYESKVDPLVALEHAWKNFAKAERREDAIYLEGLLYETRGDYERALTQYRKLTQIHSCCHSGFMHIARIQVKEGRAQEALRTLRRAEKIPGAPPKLYVELAKVYGKLKQPDNEQAMWREVIKRDPQNADLGYQHLGVLADLAGKIDEAEAHYRKCVELQPTADLYWFKLGKLLLQRRTEGSRLQDGIAALEQAVKLAPLEPDSFLELAAAYRYAGRNNEALWAARHAVDLDPGDGRGYQQVGELLLAQGRREEGQQALALYRRFRQYYQAWETLRARVRRSPADVGAKRRLAQFYERSGSLVNAVNTYAEILQTTPSDSDAQRRVAMLRQRLASQDL